jgi:hypothetical protein
LLLNVNSRFVPTRVELTLSKAEQGLQASDENDPKSSVVMMTINSLN